MRYLPLVLALVAACIPMLVGAKRVRQCYKGCHGCGRCMKSFRDGETDSGAPRRDR